MVDQGGAPVYNQRMPPTINTLKVLDLVPFGQTERKGEFFALRLERPDWDKWRPGQFLMLRPDSFGKELIWGRPFSICRVTDRHLILFIKAAGRGTDKIAALKPRDSVLVWGPLGNGFEIIEDAPTILLAGGMGIAPFVGYVNAHPQPWNLSMLFAHRAPLGCYPADSINERVAMDCLRDPQDGDLDNLIFALQERIRDCAEQNGLALACGPAPFLKVVQEFSLKFGARAQLSLENRMACGVGACLGCVCKTTSAWPVAARRGSYVQACAQGPVFWADQIAAL